MPKESASLADTLRNWINQKLDENYDYSLASNRRMDIANFVSANPKLKTTKEKARPSFDRVLTHSLKLRGIDPRVLGRKVKAPKYYGSDLAAKITPEPQAGAVEPKKPTEQKIQAGVSTTAGVPTPVPQMYANFTEEGVAASFNALFLMFRLLYPDLELLTENEKKALGTMWLPAFNRYLTEKWAIIGIPMLATMGIFLPKLITARKIKKEKEIIEKEKKLSTKEEQPATEIPKQEVFGRIEPLPTDKSALKAAKDYLK